VGYTDLLPTTKPTMVPLSDITADSAIDLEEYPAYLVPHVREEGLRRPILLAVDNGRENPYRAIVDRHLIPVLERAGLEEVPAIVYGPEEVHPAMTEIASRFQHTEDPLERACLCETLRRLTDCTVQEIADEFLVGRRTVYRYLSILDLPPLLQRMLVQGQLGITHALACAAVPPQKLLPLTETVLRHRLSLREVSRLVDLIKQFPHTSVADLTEEVVVTRTPRQERAAKTKGVGDPAGDADSVDYQRYTSRLSGSRRAVLEELARQMELDAITLRRAALLLLAEPRMVVPSAIAYARYLADTEIGRALTLIELGVERVRGAGDHGLTPNQAKVASLVLHHVHLWADEVKESLQDLSTQITQIRTHEGREG
jgi:ParB-like chromosome segregation protein Spo0J